MKNKQFKILSVGILTLSALIGLGQTINTYAGNGVAGYSGDGGQATSAALKSPSTVFIDNNGNLFIVDKGNSCVRKVTSLGIISTVAGTIGGVTSDGGQATAAQINFNSNNVQINGVVTDALGNIYISETGSHRIRKVNTSGVISTIAGVYLMQGYNGDGIQANTAELRSPSGLAVDAAGNIYIADKENHRIRKINTSGIISTIAGTGSGGYSGDGAIATSAQIQFPTSVALDATGNIYIADWGNHRIRKIDQSGIITTVAGNGSSGFSGDNGIATSSQLSGPSGIAIDGTGNLYIADASNYRIRKINLSGIITTIAGTGVIGFSGDAGPPTSANLIGPTSISVDQSGSVYINDLNRVRAFQVVSGIDENELFSNDLIVFPIPCENELNFSFASIPTNNFNQISVYNSLGQLILEQQISLNSSAKINVSNFPTGIYQVQLKSVGATITKKFIKQ